MFRFSKFMMIQSSVASSSDTIVIKAEDYSFVGVGRGLCDGSGVLTIDYYYSRSSNEDLAGGGGGGHRVRVALVAVHDVHRVHH